MRPRRRLLWPLTLTWRLLRQWGPMRTTVVLLCVFMYLLLKVYTQTLTTGGETQVWTRPMIPPLLGTRGPPTRPSWARKVSHDTVVIEGPRDNLDLPKIRADLAARPSQARGRSKHSGRWEYIRGSSREVYVYSAFYDNRESLRTLPEVRIIASVEVYPQNDTLYCHIRYDLERPLAPRVGLAWRLPIGFGAERHGKTFMAYVLSCSLPSHVVPHMVSLVREPQDQPSFLIPIEVPVKPEQQIPFGACVSVSYWHFDPHRIVEWMELMHILGVGEVTIYNNSLDAQSARVFQYYDHLGFVDFRQSHNYLSDEGEITLHMHMTPVINDCMYRNMHRYRKIVVIDLDELIVPTMHYTLSDMLVAVERTTEHKHGARMYLFNNVYMFLNLAGEDLTQSPQLVTLRHRRSLAPSERGYASKAIIDPQACTACHNHVCWTQTRGYDKPGFINEVPAFLGANLHYKNCHYEPLECHVRFNQSERNDVMLKYRDELIPRVTAVINDLGLVPL